MTLNDFGPSDFAAVSKEEWLAKARKDLRETPYESLFWQHPELGEIDPYLTKEEAPEGFILPPKAYGGGMNDWQIRQTFAIAAETDVKAVNAHILKALEHGAGGITLLLAEDVKPAQVKAVLSGVFLEMIDLTIELPESDAIIDQELISALIVKEKSHLKKGCIAYDPVTAAFNRGDKSCAPSAEAIQRHLDQLKDDRFRAFRVEAARYFEAGMSEVHEIAIALHLGHHYWKTMQKHGMTPDSVSPLIEFHLSAGSSYFPTIAKLRSFRQMWAHIAQATGIEEDCSAVTWIHATASQRHFTQNDKHNNLLRLTTSAMAAAIGGSDSLDVPSFAPWESPNAEHYRWSRNIQHLLKEESMLNVVGDPAGGSYYVEVLTDRMIDAAASAFSVLEKHPLTTREGAELVESWLQADRKALEEAFVSGQQVLIGLSKYRPENPVEEKGWEAVHGRLVPVRPAQLIYQKSAEQ